jgi:predicted Rossmann-fold nucleotide-binding protein
VAIFGSSATAPGSGLWADEMAGNRCAMAGFSVMTGGYGGTMEAASKGANLAGGEVIGVTAPCLFPTRPGANSYVTREIELPGSIGTAAELVVAWNLNHVARRNGGRRFPTVAVGDAWRQFGELLVGTLEAGASDIHTVDRATDAVDWLLTQPEISRGQTVV